jgi:ABC-type multidrug transport system fused ATPase/permease subunit
LHVTAQTTCFLQFLIHLTQAKAVILGMPPGTLSDIVALAAMIKSTTQALGGMRGSAREYTSFKNALVSLKRIIEVLEERQLPEHTRDNLRTLLHEQISHCKNLVDVATERTKKFALLDLDILPDDRGARFRLKRQWYKVQWSFTRRNEIRGLSKKLLASQRLLVIVNDILNMYASTFLE